MMVYSSAPSANSIKHIHDTVVGFVEPTEMNRPEIDGPDGVGDLFESDRVVFQKAADEDLSSIPSQGRVARDLAELEVSRVLERIRLIGEWPVGEPVNRGRGFHLERLVRSLLVIDLAESVERALLGA